MKDPFECMTAPDDVQAHWKTVRQEVGKVEAQVDELEEVLIRKNVRERVEDVLLHHSYRFAESARIINEVRRECKALRDWISHDMWSDFSTIGLQLQLARTRPEEMMVKMRSNIFVVLCAIESIRYWVPEEKIHPSVECIQDFFQSLLEFLHRRFRLLHPSGRILNIIELENDRKPLRVYMHYPTLATLIINICDNARKRGLAEKIHMKLSTKEETVQIEIADDGVGVDEDISDRIFERHFSGSNGTGLGLADAKERMAMMKGSIQCEPHGGIDRGAKFTLELQKVREPACCG